MMGIVVQYKLNGLFQQEKFYNDRTFNLSKASVVKITTKFAAQAVGNSFYSAIEAGFKDRNTDLKTRVSFKVRKSIGADPYTQRQEVY